MALYLTHDPSAASSFRKGSSDSSVRFSSVYYVFIWGLLVFRCFSRSEANTGEQVPTPDTIRHYPAHGYPPIRQHCGAREIPHTRLIKKINTLACSWETVPSVNIVDFCWKVVTNTDQNLQAHISPENTQRGTVTSHVHVQLCTSNYRSLGCINSRLECSHYEPQPAPKWAKNTFIRSMYHIELVNVVRSGCGLLHPGKMG